MVRVSLEKTLKPHKPFLPYFDFLLRPRVLDIRDSAAGTDRMAASRRPAPAAGSAAVQEVVPLVLSPWPGVEELYRVCFGFSPAPHQRELYDQMRTAALQPAEGTPVWVLEAPTGEGKTEAAVAPFLAQFAAGHFPLATRLIYVLPSQALCNSLGARLRRAAVRLHSAWPPGSTAGAPVRRPPHLVVEVHHGSHPLDPALFGDITVTTLDQVILGYARASRQVGRHLELPAGSLATSLVVLDEVHGYDGYTWALLRALIEILVQAGVPLLLMTATLPPSLLQDLLACPLASPPPRIHRIAFDPQTARVRRPVVPQILDEPLWDGERLAPAALDRLTALPPGTRALVVCNTVQTAQRVYDALEGAGLAPVLVHSRFRREDRDGLEREVLNRLGKGGSGGVVIATQVCEAGIDISADLLITELCPADALVQRLGRYRRWPGAGGTAHGVLVFAGGTPAPYEATYVEATRRWLREHPGADLGQWANVRAFVAQLPYRADDAAAAEALRELYDATLYADAAPTRLLVRDAYAVHAWVPGPEDGSFAAVARLLAQAREGAERTAALARYRAGLIPIPYGVAARHKDQFRPAPRKPLQRVVWTGTGQEAGWELQDTEALLPMATYLLPPERYDPKKGVVWD